MTHICVGKLIIIGSDNGLSPGRHQAIIWTNAALLSIGPLRTYFSENLFKIQQFLLKKLHVKMSSAKWRPSCLGLHVLIAEGNRYIMAYISTYGRCEILHGLYGDSVIFGALKFSIWLFFAWMTGRYLLMAKTISLAIMIFIWSYCEMGGVVIHRNCIWFHLYGHVSELLLRSTFEKMPCYWIEYRFWKVFDIFGLKMSRPK